MKRLFALVLALAVLAPAVLLAKHYPHEEAKVTMWLPDTWKIDKEDDMLAAVSPGDEVAMMFFVLKAEDVDKAVAEMEKALDSLIKDVKSTGEPTVTKLNGMVASFGEARGKVDGADVELAIGLIETPAKRVLMVLGIAQAGKLERHQKDVDKMLSSIKPLEKKKGW